jgi:ADP-ribose pyrophosphatase
MWRADLTNEKTLSSELVYDGRAVRLRVEKVEMPSGRQITREIVEHSDCVAIIAVDENDTILLVNQFRKAVGKELLEIPAGGIDPGEDAETAVRREMQEETGYLPRKVEQLGGFYSAPGYCSEYLYLYLATELVPSQLYAEDTENIRLVRVTVSEIPGLLSSGKIGDSKSIAGLLTYLEYRKAR